MDITPDNSTTQPISDDQELAKALAGVLPDDPSSTTDSAATGMQFEETAVPSSTTPPADAPASDPAADVASLLPPLPDPSAEETNTSTEEVSTTPNANTSELEGIKKEMRKEGKTI